MAAWRNHRIFKNCRRSLLTGKFESILGAVEATGEGDRYVITAGRYFFYFGVAGGCYQLLELAADPEAAS